MFSGHSIVTINNYDLIQVSDIKNYSANFNPHLYFILGIPRWYFKKVRSCFFDRTKKKKKKKKRGQRKINIYKKE